MSRLFSQAAEELAEKPTSLPISFRELAPKCRPRLAVDIVHEPKTKQPAVNWDNSVTGSTFDALVITAVGDLQHDCAVDRLNIPDLKLANLR